MADPITLKGIQRNASKLAVEDGRAEDLINLRFKDGSWRTAGNGKQVFAMTNETTGVVYEQLYIHTNASYHHILGVNPADSKLYWFANIEDDGETFTALDTPQEIYKVSGDLLLSTVRNLIVVTTNNRMMYSVYKSYENRYVNVVTEDGNNEFDRNIYPQDAIKFFWYGQSTGIHFENVAPFTAENCHNKIVSLLGEWEQKNVFFGPFAIIVAIELYDGSFAFSSNPIYMSHLEKPTSNLPYINSSDTETNREHVYWGMRPFFPEEVGRSDNKIDALLSKRTFNGTEIPITSTNSASAIGTPAYPVITCYNWSLTKEYNSTSQEWTSLGGAIANVCSGNLMIYINNCDILKANSTIFKSLAVFITKPISWLNNPTSTTQDWGTFDQKIVKRTGNYECPSFSGYGDWTSKSEYYTPKLKPFENIRQEIMNSNFYLLKKYSIDEVERLVGIHGKEAVTVGLEDGYLSNITSQTMLEIESTDRYTYIPKVQYMYNGRLHIANYKKVAYTGYPIDSFLLQNHKLSLSNGSIFKGVIKDWSQWNNNVLYVSDNDAQWRSNDENQELPVDAMLISQEVPIVSIRTFIKTDDNDIVSSKYIKAYDTTIPCEGRLDVLESLNPILSYPDSRAVKMTISYVVKDSVSGLFYIKEKDFTLQSHTYLNISCYIEENLKPIPIKDFPFVLDDNGNPQSFSIDEIINRFKLSGMDSEYATNVLRVSKTHNPYVFPVELSYEVGNSTILALCSNAIAVGTGQTGEAPLYVFCTDGIYALYVDASGEMAYTNARVIARDVCNNAKSVTPTDQGVVFTTDRGLMEIAGDVVNEIGQPAEGDVVEYPEPDWAKPLNVGKNMLTKVAELPLNLVDGVDFLSYLRGAIVNYNHNERELMISNPAYPYTYVLDRYSNWSRRDYTADEYVNNFPTSYRVKDGVFYKVDAEQDGLEGKSEAPNKFLYLSNVLKLGSVDFKQAYRFVVRGKFNTNNGTENKVLGCYIFGSYDGNQFALLGANEKKGQFTDIGCKIERTDVKYFRIGLAGNLSGDSRIDFMEIEGAQSNLTTKLR